MFRKRDFSLRELTIEDRDLILIWRNSDRVRPFMYNDHIIHDLEHKRWFNQVLTHLSCYYRIFQYQDTPLGLICASQIDSKNNKCYWGYYIGADNTLVGTGSVIEFFALEYLFEALNIRKLCGEVIASNSKALHLHKKFGFIEEGKLNQHIKKAESYVDVITIALFKNTWLQMKPSLHTVLFQ